MVNKINAFESKHLNKHKLQKNLLVKSGISDTANYLSKLTFRKVFNVVMIYSSYFFSLILRRPVHWGAPVSASIEATTCCNLRCPECPSGLRKFTRPTGSVSIANFRNYIVRLEKSLTYLMIYFQGEPYLNKDFFEIVKYAVSEKIYTATSTNGHFLDIENARQTIESGLDRLIISIDGVDQESYSSYRTGGDFEKVMRGIKNVVEWKTKLASKKPYIILQFLVLKTNEQHIEEIKKLSGQSGADELQIKTAQFYDFKNGNPLMPLNTRYSRYIKNNDGTFSLKKKIKNKCLRMWQSLVITWDGNVVPCCFDKDAGYNFGNLNELTLKEIWKGKSAGSFRKQIIKNRKAVEICCNCSE